MKVIVVGATGFIGGHILLRCLLSPLITTVVAVARRKLPDELGGRKLQQVIIREQQDWVEWKDERNLKFFEGAAACFWCVGGRPKSFESNDEYLQVTYTYPAAFVRTILQVNLAERFRFCYMSSWGADLTEKKFRVIDKKNAYLKGRTENLLFGLTQGAGASEGGAWELYTFRPGTVLDPQGHITKNGFRGFLAGNLVPSIEIKVLTAAVLHVGLHGYGDDGMSVFFENKVIVERGIEAGEVEAEQLKFFEEQSRRLKENKGRLS